MSEFRRRLMEGSKSSPSWQYNYVDNGLIFQLDGSDSSTMTENTWTDKIGGIIMETPQISREQTGFSFKSYGGDFSGAVLVCDYVFPSNADYNVDIVFKTTGPSQLFGSGTVTANNLVFYTTGRQATFLQRAGKYDAGKILADNNIHTFSANMNNGLVDGVEMTFLGSDYWSGCNCTAIGEVARTAKNVMGTVYALRIYNRRLTISEQMQNQQADNERFNLGLTI